MTTTGSAPAGDTNGQKVDEPTTAKQEAQPTTQEGTKTKWEKHLDATKQKLDEKDAKIDEVVKSNEQLKAEVDEIKANADRNIAIAKFGEEAVDHEQVKAVKEKYPTMSYDEAIKLAGIEVAEVDRTKAYNMGGQSKVEFDDTKTTYTLAEVEVIAEKDPKKYEELRQKRNAGTVKFI